jgi:outer membrane protein assembly factor BamB
VAPERGVVAYDSSAGIRRFQIDEQDNFPGGQLAIADGTLYRRIGWRTIAAYDVETGRQRWTYSVSIPDANSALGSYGVADGVVVAYGASEDQHHVRRSWLIAIDTADGHELWRQPVGERNVIFIEQPLLVDGRVITVDDDNALVARSTADGSARWRMRRARARDPAASGDLILTSDLEPRWRHWLITLGIARLA